MPDFPSPGMHLIFWGTYDTGKPRVRILLRGLKAAGVQITECHQEVWQGVEDKSQVKKLGQRLWLLMRWVLAYPRLIWCYLTLPEHDAVIVPYMGHIDVILLHPLARLRRVPIVWDALISSYNTLVEDRGMVRPGSLSAHMLKILDRLACRSGDLVLFNTPAKAEYFIRNFKLNPAKAHSVLIGVETDAFPPRTPSETGVETAGPLKVLFYGQFIPLHGVETIVQSAQLLDELDVQWTFIGHGQEAERIRNMLAEKPIKNLNWLPWVPYEDLVHWIHDSDVCLGIFSDSEKASRSLPNKVFQMLSAGVPLITRDSPAARYLLNPGMPGVYLVPPADPQALAEAIREVAVSRHRWLGMVLHREIISRCSPEVIGKGLARRLEGLIRDH